MRIKKINFNCAYLFNRLIITILMLAPLEIFATIPPLNLMQVPFSSNVAIANQTNEYAYILKNNQQEPVDFTIELTNHKINVNPKLSSCRNHLPALGMCRLVINFKSPKIVGPIKAYINLSIVSGQMIKLPLIFNVIAKTNIHRSPNSVTSKLHWQAMPGPDGGSITSIVVSPDNGDVLYAASNNIYKSTNGGQSWTTTLPLIDNMGNNYTSYVVQLVINQGVLYALVNKGSFIFIFESTDQGQHWSQLNTSELPNSSYPYLVTTQQALYVSTDEGIYLSKDGVNWNALSQDNNIGGNFIVQGKTIYSGGNLGVTKSVDGGNSWETMNNFPNGVMPQVSTLLNVNGTIYVGTSSNNYDDDNNIHNDAVFKSTDGGQTWSDAGYGLDKCPIINFAVQGNAIYALTLPFYISPSDNCMGGIYKTIDGGNSWNPVNTGLTYYNVNNIAASNSTLYAATNGGVLASNNGGNNWQSINEGIKNNSVTSLLSLQNGTVYAGTLNGGIFKSTDDGITWTDLNKGITTANTNNNGVSSIVADDQGNIYALDGVTIYKLAKNSENWTIISPPQNLGVQILPTSILISGTALYAESMDGIYRTLDSGLDWELLSNYAINNPYVMALLDSTNSLYYILNPSTIWSMPANGANEGSSMNGNLPLLININKIVTVNNLPYSLLYVATNQGIYINKGGNNWTALNNPLPAYENITSLYSNGHILIIGSADDGIYLSEDGGKSWLSANDGIDQKDSISNFSENNNFIFATAIPNVLSNNSTVVGFYRASKSAAGF